MNKNTLFALLLLLGIVQVEAQKLVTIRGHVNNPRSSIASVQVNYNALNNEMESFGGMVANGDFTIQFTLTEAGPARFTHGEIDADMYLHPGDSMYVTFDGLDYGGTANFSGRGAKENQFLAQFSKRFKGVNLANPNSPEVRLKPNQFHLMMQDQRRKQHNFLAEYSINNPLPKDFLDYAQTRMDSEWAIQMLDYPIAHAIMTQTVAPEMPADYYSFLDDIDVDNEDALSIQAYTDFLIQYLNRKFKASVDEQTFHPDSYHVKRYECAEEIIQGKTLYYVLAKTIMDGCNNGKVEYMSGKYVEFLKNCPYEEYKKVIEDFFAVAGKLGAGNEAPPFTLSDPSGRKVSLSDYKGKVVYLDFWATWCGPCVAEFPHAHSLRQEFVGKDVAFVYVSVDDDYSRWSTYVMMQGGQGIHLNTPGLKTPMTEAYNLKAVPRYMLIDRKGFIADSNAKKPSEKGIKEDIEMLLAVE